MEIFEKRVVLDKLPLEIIRPLVSYQAIIDASKDLVVLKIFDEILDKWIRKVNQLIIQSDEIRLESDDTGPMAELNHFRIIAFKFNSVLEQLKEPESKLLIQVLNAAGNRKLLVRLIKVLVVVNV